MHGKKKFIAWRMPFQVMYHSLIASAQLIETRPKLRNWIFSQILKYFFKIREYHFWMFKRMTLYFKIFSFYWLIINTVKKKQQVLFIVNDNVSFLRHLITIFLSNCAVFSIFVLICILLLLSPRSSFVGLICLQEVWYLEIGRKRKLLKIRAFESFIMINFELIILSYI